jgi:hypothetical protein
MDYDKFRKKRAGCESSTRLSYGFVPAFKRMTHCFSKETATGEESICPVQTPAFVVTSLAWI